MKKRSAFLLLLLVSLLYSCRFKPADGLSWDQQLVAPIVQSRLDLRAALTDTNRIVTHPDQTLSIVFRDTIADLSLARYLQVPDTSYAASITLDQISLASDTLNQSITMGQILRALCAQGYQIACSLTQGQAVPPLPAIANLAGPTQQINASQFFQEADLISGWMVVELSNHLPLAIDSVRYRLRNDGQFTNTLIASTIHNIQPDSVKRDSSSLAGQTAESMLAAIVESISIAASNGFTLDTNRSLDMRIIVHSLHASRATAVFPAQRVIDDYSRINYQFGNGVAITKLKTRTGRIVLDAFSTLQDTLAFTYGLPTAIKNGQSVRIEGRLVPHPNGAQAHLNVPLDDYYIDLTLNGDSVNLFPYRLTGDMLYSGVLHTMDLSDTIDISYGLVDIEPAYIEGYFGQNTFHFRDSIHFDVFNAILGGTLALHAPTVSVTVANSIGVDAELRIRQMDAVNHRTNTQQPLTGSIVSRPTEIRGPQLPNVGQTVTTLFKLDAQNSNIQQFLSTLPDEIRMDLELLVNKNGNPALRNNFATDASRLAAFLDMEVPLDAQADQLWLQDTFALNLGQGSLPRSIQNGRLKLLCRNQFPFDIVPQVFFLDHQGAIFDSLFTGTATPRIPAGTVNSQGYVDLMGVGELSSYFDQPRFVQLRQRGAQCIVRLRFTTRPTGQHVRLYSTYGIDFQLVGDFTHRVGD